MWLMLAMLDPAGAGLFQGDGTSVRTSYGRVPTALARLFCEADTSYIGSVVSHRTFTAKVYKGQPELFLEVKMKVLTGYAGIGNGQVDTVVVPARSMMIPNLRQGKRYVLALKDISPLPYGWVQGQRYVSTTEAIPDDWIIPPQSELIGEVGRICASL